jgi:hypothetical protein
MDIHSTNAENNFYLVNNLYFDSPDHLFLKRRIEGCPNRFNMRIRSYENNPGRFYYFEIKNKVGNIIRKYRSSEAPDLSVDGAEVQNRRLFDRLLHTYDASPKILMQYHRMAWISDVDDYARVTFDINLRCMPETRFNLTPHEDEMVSCDSEIVFDPGCSVILELKCFTSYVPLWMLDLIKYFNLNRRSFSKYMSGMNEVFRLYRYDTAIRSAAVPHL